MIRTRRDKHPKKPEAINVVTLPWEVFIASQRHWKWSDNVFPRHSGNVKFALQTASESMINFCIFEVGLFEATSSFLLTDGSLERNGSSENRNVIWKTQDLQDFRSLRSRTGLNEREAPGKVVAARPLNAERNWVTFHMPSFQLCRSTGQKIYKKNEKKTNHQTFTSTVVGVCPMLR